MSEPGLTAWFLTAAGALMALSVVLSRASGRLGVPAALLFLLVGVLAGAEGIAGFEFDDYEFAFRVGTISLVLILFDGGFNTPYTAVRRGLGPGLTLATAGVLATAGLLALGARWIGFDWPEALLIGAVVSSTDAAAVFSILRSSGLHLKRRVGTILELESGLNDPVAVILTVAVTNVLIGRGELRWDLLGAIAGQLAIGGVLGLAIGHAGRLLLRHLVLPIAGLYPVLTLGLALLAFGLPTLLDGSGFLAVYLTGLILGNGAVPYRTGLVRVHDAVAWFAQVAMFLMLGLLVLPSELLDVAGAGLFLGLFLCLVARPLAVLGCLAPFRLSPREGGYLAWVGLRGAVPIILATFPVLAEAPGAERLFHVVFFVVVVSVVLQGGTVRWLTRRLGLRSEAPPPPPAMLEITSVQDLSGQLLSFYVDEASALAGSPLREIPFPEGSAVVLVVRGRQLIAPKGDTELRPGDHVFVFCRPEDHALIRLLFGREYET